MIFNDLVHFWLQQKIIGVCTTSKPSLFILTLIALTSKYNTITQAYKIKIKYDVRMKQMAKSAIEKYNN